MKNAVRLSLSLPLIAGLLAACNADSRVATADAGLRDLRHHRRAHDARRAQVAPAARADS